MKTVVLFLAVWLAASAEAAQPKGWERDWEQTLAAAKKEGSVVVAGAPDPVMRRDIIPLFTSRFGIPVEFIAGRSSEMVSRLRAERQAGLRTIDIFMPGISPAVTLYNEKMIDPLRPILVLPEVADPSKWKKGKLWFVDPEEKFVLRVFNSVTGPLHINSGVVAAGEMRAARDLLNPKWKGKISTEDPTDSGSGQNQASRFYMDLGEEFVKRLYLDQKPVITRERRQLADWLARGTYPICLSCREDDVNALRQEGFKIQEIFELSDLRPTVGSSPWLLAVVNQAPHPNAARAFANWMASKEALEAYSRGHKSVTLRSDVDESFLRAETIPKPGVSYFDTSDWNWAVKGKREVEERVQRLLKPR